GHTDLVLPAIGEEWGFVGVAAIALLFAFLVRRSFRIARAAADEYAFFLAVGLASLFALEMLLISAGVLGAIPLSGVVSPFLSSGNTAMLANFLLFALILSVSNQDPRPEIGQPFARPMRYLAGILGACALVLVARAAYFQVVHDSNEKLQGYHDYRELAPLIRYRHQPGNSTIQQLENRDRNVHTSIDIRLQLRATEILERRLHAAKREKAAVVVMDAQSGDVLALVSLPEPEKGAPGTPDELLDRARYGQYPPGSTFKLVTAIAALRLNPQLTSKTFQCRSFGGRGGAQIPGWRRIIRAAIGDPAHGPRAMR